MGGLCRVFGSGVAICCGIGGLGSRRYWGYLGYSTCVIQIIQIIALQVHINYPNI